MTRPLDRLAALGKPGAFIGRELDLARSLGPRLAWSRLRAEGGAAMPPSGRRQLYRHIWEDAARRVGADVSELPGGFLEIRRGGAMTRVREQLVPLDDPVVLKLAGDKPLVHDWLVAAGMPVPEHAVFAAGDVEGPAAFVAAGPPCVVKPASGSGRGDGITGFVRDGADFRRARLRSLRYDSERLLVERQAAGGEYRVLVMDGEAVGIVRRDPPHVTGDGRSSILELIHAENARRAAAAGKAGLWLLDVDLDTLLALRAQDLDLRAVPAAGRRVRVRSGSSQGSEREAHVVPLAGGGHDGIVAGARKAASVIGSAYAGVEIITPDPAADLADAGGMILEINTTPGLAQHYLVADEDKIEPVAAAVLERLLSRAQGG